MRQADTDSNLSPAPSGSDVEHANFIERARLAAVVESSHDAIVSKNLDGRIQTWNAAAERLFGYSAAEVLGCPITVIIPEELQAEEREILDRIRRGERIYHFETVRLTKDGRRVPVSLTVSPVRDLQGRIVGASKIARDISERAAHVDALAKLNECTARLWSCHTFQEGLEEILSAVLDLLSAQRGNIRLLDNAHSTLRIVAHRGFDPQFLDLFCECSIRDDSPCARALRAGRRILIEDVETEQPRHALLDVGGAAGYRAIVSVPLIGPDGTPFGVLSAYFAATHTPSEQQLRILDLFVRHACDFIRRCRMEQALRLREESLREGDRRKDEFLALLAHELRNPLAPVRYALATIRKPGITTEQQTRAHEIIERQVAHMSRLLDDLMDVSRITRGIIELKKSPTHLTSVLEAAIDAARPLIDARQHTLVLELPDTPVCLEADSVRLTQVFSNLLINAAKYTQPKGQIRLQVVRQHHEVVICVRDNGIGISAELMPRLFMLFTQAHSALERSEVGLGVGLALVRGLVTLHGGQVQAISEGPNRGSEFIVRLPVSATAGSGAAGTRQPAPHIGGGLEVLVVDDNRDVADSCKALLELSGHRVHAAYSGEEAFALAQNLCPQVILLDIGLPDINGYELARRIRATPWGPKAELIAITGWGQDTDRDRAFRAGFDHHLTKPIASDALETLLQSLHPGAA